MTIDDTTTDEQRAEAIEFLKKLIDDENAERPAWMIEARKRADRIQAAMQKQREARDHVPAHAATAATFRADKEDLPTASQKAEQHPQYSEDEMMVFMDDLGERVR